MESKSEYGPNEPTESERRLQEERKAAILAKKEKAAAARKGSMKSKGLSPAPRLRYTRGTNHLPE